MKTLLPVKSGDILIIRPEFRDGADEGQVRYVALENSYGGRFRAQLIGSEYRIAPVELLRDYMVDVCES